MASQSNPPADPPSLSNDIARSLPGKLPSSLDEEEQMDIARMRRDILAHHAAISRTSGATEPASAYRTVLLTDKQINYLLVILKPYVSPIAEECRVKLESA
jgi:hypothetical protein